jgi:wyosine [tRNA(Phe)-imidazoG37] synthetase (radical SAM superfamily)
MKLLVADSQGTIFDHPSLAPAVQSGTDWLPAPSPKEWQVLPQQGSLLLSLPGRKPVGFDTKRGTFEVVETLQIGKEKRPVFAVGAVFPTGFTRSYLPAYQSTPTAPLLPLYAYTAVAARQHQTVGLAIKTERRERWNPEFYFQKNLQALVDVSLQKDPENRLLQQIARCATEYGCYNAQNIFYGHWEGGLPVSAGCNSRCLGCISLQDKDGVPSAQERIGGAPFSVEQIVTLSVPHLNSGPFAQVSFGQGCEGEPTLRADLMEASIREIRKQTSAGTIHVNTNGSRPQFLARLVEAGLQSARVSLNAAKPELYNAYYRPMNYTLDDVRSFIRELKSKGGFVSLNLLVFPGVTDRPEEVEALCALLREDKPDMIQPRSLCIDPAVYLGALEAAQAKPIGMSAFFARITKEFPRLALGNFNVPKEEFEWARQGFGE